MSKMLMKFFFLFCSFVVICLCVQAKDNSHRYIFVGGVHQSGTSVVERLFSSAPWSSGLRVDLTSLAASEAARICLRLPQRMREYS
jgi:hypothetical protein